MARLQNVTTSGDHTTLAVKDGSIRGTVGAVRVCNYSSDAGGAMFDLYLENASAVKYYIAKDVKIPRGVTLTILDCSFDYKTYSLKMYNTGTDPKLTVTLLRNSNY